MNLVGTQTLLAKEVRRFLRVPGQTVLQPLISTSLYFVVFGFGLGGRQHEVEGVSYLSFIVPGLLFLGIANNAFMNASSSIFICKMQGTLVDLLVAPLGPAELLIGFITGAMVRGMLVGLLTWLVAICFTGVQLVNPLSTLVFVTLSAYVFAVLGFLAGVWAEKFEQVNFFPTFLMLPMTFLGGVFYSVEQLPEPYRTISLFNPVVHMVAGLRHGMLGIEHTSLFGLVILVTVAVVSTAVGWRMLATGYKLKS